MMKSTDAVRSFAALAHESRLELFRLLVKRGPEGYTPGELAEKLGVTAPALSFHLKELQHADLIESRREGRFLFYSPNFSQMNKTISFLMANCCELADSGCSPECAPRKEEVVTLSPKRKRA